MTARLPKIAHLSTGSSIGLRIDPADLYVFHPATGRRVLALARRSSLYDADCVTKPTGLKQSPVYRTHSQQGAVQ